MSRTPASGGSEASERIYDPLWANARTLLDYLDAREMIRRDLSDARIGEFVLVSGELAILDLPMLRQLWELPIVRATLQSGVKSTEETGTNPKPLRNRAERRRSDHQSPISSTTIGDNPAEFILQAIKYLPHAIQTMLTTLNKVAVWCSISEESLVGSSADLMLKHGAILSEPGYRRHSRRIAGIRRWRISRGSCHRSRQHPLGSGGAELGPRGAADDGTTFSRVWAHATSHVSGHLDIALRSREC